jgi:alkylhydroperoxidase/carboxymuconolactone decarboxylase family protein YurZ
VSDVEVTANGRERAERRAGAGTAQARLRQLASASRTTSWQALDAQPPRTWSSGLDGRTDALVRLAALVAMEGPEPAYRSTIEAALEGGATQEEVIGTMIAVAPTVGLSRLVAATEGMATALGYDLDAALECVDPPAGEEVPPKGHRSRAEHGGA